MKLVLSSFSIHKKEHSVFKTAVLVLAPETVNKCFQLRTPKMEMDTNLKKSGQRFQVLLQLSGPAEWVLDCGGVREGGGGGC